MSGFRTIVISEPDGLDLADIELAMVRRAERHGLELMRNDEGFFLRRPEIAAGSSNVIPIRGTLNWMRRKVGTLPSTDKQPTPPTAA